MEAFIYRIQPYLEHSKLLFVYTEEGKKTLLAQGAQKLNSILRIPSQLFNLVDFENKDKDFIKVYQLELIDDFNTIKQSYPLFKYWNALLEIIAHILIEKQQDQWIFTQMKDCLTHYKQKESLLKFLLSLLTPLGYKIDLAADGRAVKGFSISQGRIIYEHESIHATVSIELLIIVLKLIKTPYHKLESLSDDDFNQTIAFIKAYYMYHLQYQFKSL